MDHQLSFCHSFLWHSLLMNKDTAISYAKKNNINIILYKENVLYKSEELDYVKTL